MLLLQLVPGRRRGGRVSAAMAVMVPRPPLEQGAGMVTVVVMVMMMVVVPGTLQVAVERGVRRQGLHEGDTSTAASASGGGFERSYELLLLLLLLELHEE